MTKQPQPETVSANQNYGDDAESARDRLKAAITKHHNQKADDRCWMDDAELYRAAGFETMDAHVGDQDAMLRNCQRFIACRTMGGVWKSYAELEAERDTLQQMLGEMELRSRNLARAAIAKAEAEGVSL